MKPLKNGEPNFHMRGIFILSVIAIITQLSSTGWNSASTFDNYATTRGGEEKILNCTTPVQITTSPSSDFRGSFIQDSNDIYWVTFSSDRAGNSDIWVSRSSDCIDWNYGYTVVGPPGITDGYPCLLQDKNDVYWIAFNSWNNDEYHIYITKSTEGSVWDMPVQISDWYDYEGAPSIIQDSSGVFWMIFTKNCFENVYDSMDIFLTKSQDGLNWDDPAKILSSQPAIRNARLYPDQDGTLWVTYSTQSQQSGNVDIYAINTSDGKHWSSPVQFTDNDEIEMDPFFIQDENNTYWLTWSLYQGAWNSLQVSGSIDCTDWAVPSTVSTEDSSLRCPNIIEDAENDFFVTWYSEMSGNNDIWISKIINLTDSYTPPPIEDLPPNIINTTFYPDEVTNDGKTELILFTEVVDINEDLERVVIDLRSIEGKSNQLMFDDGTHGDVYSGDNTFSYNTTILNSITPGHKELIINASDRKGLTTEAIIVILVIEVSNEKPISILYIDNLNPYVGESVIFNASDSSDPDGKVISFYFEFGDGNHSGWIDNPIIEHEYTLSGSFWVYSKVKDDFGEESELSKKTQINVRDNNPPIILDILVDANQINIGGSVNISVLAEDEDGDNLEYYYQPEFGKIVGSGKDVTWVAPEMLGTYKIIIRVFDGIFYSPEMNISIRVVERNWRPHIDNISISSGGILPGGKVNLSVKASDPDGDFLEYLYSIESGAIIGSGSDVTWQAPNADGSFSIYVNVFDGGLYSVKKSVTIIVREHNAPPIIEDILLNKSDVKLEDSLEIEVIASDPDRDDEIAYHYSCDIGLIRGNGNTAIWYAPNISGVYNITIYVEDLFNATVSENVSISVVNPNDEYEIHDSNEDTDNENSIIKFLINNAIISLFIIIGLVLLVSIFLYKKREAKKVEYELVEVEENKDIYKK